MALQTPSEIKLTNPKIPFTESELGTLLSLKLVKGAKKSTLTLIDYNSVLELLNYRNLLIKSDIF